jgi:hypothetical protein
MTNNYADNQPLASSLGQVEHQTSYTAMGNIVDHDEKILSIVEQSGLPITSDDELLLKEYIKSAVSIDNILDTYYTSSREALLKLLALQDNKHPLKKGGIGIAYRTDALIMHFKMEFSADENVVFDAILGVMSTYPENLVYEIKASDFLPYTKYSNPKQLYSAFKKGAAKLENRRLELKDLGADDHLSLAWNEVCHYNSGKDAYIKFIPTPFFKDLALCSTVVHGAYGNLMVTTQLQGKYTIAMYWFLENRKAYREYKGATPGVFEMSIEEIKHQFSIPDSYKPADIKRRVLEEPKKQINQVPECDIIFDYEVKKVNGIEAGYLFKITSKQAIEKKPTLELPEKANPMYEQLKMFIAASALDFTADEILKICNHTVMMEKDLAYAMQVVVAFKQRLEDSSLDPIDDKVSYLCKMIELGTEKNSRPKKSNVNQINTQNYDDLEELLLDN